VNEGADTVIVYAAVATALSFHPLSDAAALSV